MCIGIIAATTTTTERIAVSGLAAPEWTPIEDDDIVFETKSNDPNYAYFVITLPRALGQIADLSFVWQNTLDSEIETNQDEFGTDDNANEKRALAPVAAIAIIESEYDITTNGQGRGANNFALNIKASAAAADSTILAVRIVDINRGNIAIGISGGFIAQAREFSEKGLYPLT